MYINYFYIFLIFDISGKTDNHTKLKINGKKKIAGVNQNNDIQMINPKSPDTREDKNISDFFSDLWKSFHQNKYNIGIDMIRENPAIKIVIPTTSLKKYEISKTMETINIVFTLIFFTLFFILKMFVCEAIQYT